MAPTDLELAPAEVEVTYHADGSLVLVDQEGAACHTGERSCFHRELPTAGAA